MRRANTPTKMAYAFLVLGVIALILNRMATGSAYGGNWATIASNFTVLIPYLFFMGAGIVFFFMYKPKFLGSVLTCFMIGVGNAGLVYSLYGMGVWFDQVIVAPNTAEDYMIIIIVAWVILGFIVGAARRS